MQKRERLIQELIETERTYVAQLSALETLYILPLRSKSSVIAVKQSDVLFSNVQSLKLMNEGELLNKLTASTETDAIMIGKILLDFCPYFALYQTYAKFHSEAINLMKKLMKNSKFFAFHEEKRNDPLAKGLGLSSLLVTPIQRVPRYLMLLKEIISTTSSDHPDYNNLLAAQTQIQAAAANINLSVRAPKEGWLSKQGGKNADKGWKKRYCVCEDGTMAYYTDERCSTKKGSFSVQGARLTVFAAGVHQPHGEEQAFHFGVTPYSRVFNSRQFVLEAVNENVGKEWWETFLTHGAVDDGLTSVDDTTSAHSSVREGMLKYKSVPLNTAKEDKIPSVKSWPSRYVVLTSNSIQVFRSKPKITDEPLEQFPLTKSFDLESEAKLQAAAFSVVNSDYRAQEPMKYYFGSNDDKAGAAELVEWQLAVKSVVDALVVKAEAPLLQVEMMDGEAIDAPPRLTGEMQRKAKSWKNTFFVLEHPKLLFYNEKGGKLTGSFCMRHDTLIQLDRKSYGCSLSNTATDVERAAKVLFKGKNNKELQLWVKALFQSIQFLEIELLNQQAKRAVKHSKATDQARYKHILTRQESNVSKDMFDFKVEDNLSVLQSMKSGSSPSSGRPKIERNLSSSSLSSVSSSSVGSFPAASSFCTSDEGSTLSRLASTPLSATLEEDQLGIFTSPPPIVEEPVPKRLVKKTVSYSDVLDIIVDERSSVRFADIDSDDFDDEGDDSEDEKLMQMLKNKKSRKPLPLPPDRNQDEPAGKPLPQPPDSSDMSGPSPTPPTTSPRTSGAKQLPGPPQGPPPAGDQSSPPVSQRAAARALPGPPASPPRSPRAAARALPGPPASPPRSPRAASESLPGPPASPPRSPRAASESLPGPPASPPRSPRAASESLPGPPASPPRSPRAASESLPGPPASPPRSPRAASLPGPPVSPPASPPRSPRAASESLPGPPASPPGTLRAVSRSLKAVAEALPEPSATLSSKQDSAPALPIPLPP
eukprot:CAMPEP_0175129318 /NCGR_PEP_ID=MMETSP0087-20121206/5403_1 /TAXON_ID=136419 /ORGANISM="Unknown Unknown, Strain D1" /LENGTH=989 /DNA_ID=CAMNT_0016411449 /DNA_START=1 /DNA_END=2967 /DNA_ORIENTATION=-